MRFALLLVLFFPGLSFGESIQVLHPEVKQKLLQRLDTLEARLQDSRQSLEISEELIQNLRTELSQVREELSEVSSMLTDSKSLISELESRLTKASETLNTLEQQLKGSQFWKWVFVSIAALTGFGIGLIF